MVSQRSIRIIFFTIVLLSSSVVGYDYAVGSTTETFESHLTDQGGVDRQTEIVAPRDEITVIATDSNSWRGEASSGPRARAELVAFNPNGTVRYYNDSHTRYWDVDQVPGTKATVEYMFADHRENATCPETWDLEQRGVDEERWSKYREARSTGACTRNGYERVNLTTGDVTRLWSRVTPGKEATRYHDADRVNATSLVVADIYLDRVFLVNTTTGRTSWSWNASDAFDPQRTGGPYPEDWSHINDVEALEDGRIMVSIRNHDRVVFLNRSTGLQENWTLGAEDEYGTLYEQHNPDYIPRENGGPAVLVADSENNRVVEYQRQNGTWNRTWTWRDARMQWPRDADRLPNGNTLITDSNGNRVFEVNRRGEVVWSVNIAFPYEAERLETGDESTNGPSASKAGLETRTGGAGMAFWITVKDLLPGRYLNGLMYVTPPWVGLPELVALAVLLLGLAGWGAMEVYWRLSTRNSKFPGLS